jgi:hypothetical protein
MMMTKPHQNEALLKKETILIPVVSALLFYCVRRRSGLAKECKKSFLQKPGNLLKTYYDKTTFKIKDEKEGFSQRKKAMN